MPPQTDNLLLLAHTLIPVYGATRWADSSKTNSKRCTFAFTEKNLVDALSKERLREKAREPLPSLIYLITIRLLGVLRRSMGLVIGEGYLLAMTPSDIWLWSCSSGMIDVELCLGIITDKCWNGWPRGAWDTSLSQDKWRSLAGWVIIHGQSQACCDCRVCGLIFL